MKNIFLLNILIFISVNANTKSKNNELIFDVTFGHANTIFDKGPDKGKSFKAVREAHYKEISDMDNFEKLLPDVPESKLKTFIIYFYYFKINPNANEIAFHNRIEDIYTSRDVLTLNGYNPEATKEEWFYILTGEKLEPNHEFSKKSENEYSKKIEEYSNLLKERKAVFIDFIVDILKPYDKLSRTKKSNNIDEFKEVKNILGQFLIPTQFEFEKDLEEYKKSDKNYDTWFKQKKIENKFKSDDFLKSYFKFLENVNKLDIESEKIKIA